MMPSVTRDVFAALYEGRHLGPEPPPVARRAYIASLLYHVIKSGFCHWRNVDAQARFDGDFSRYLDCCIEARTRADYVRSSMRLMAGLDNSHTGFHELALEPAEVTTGFLARPYGSGWIVTQSDRPDLRRGDVIDAVDGQPAVHWAGQFLDLIGKSSLRAKLMSLFRFPLLPPYFTLRLADGNTVTIDRTRPYPRRLPAREVTLSLIAHDVALLTVPGFALPEHELTAIELLRTVCAETVILDLRGNDGGSTPDALLAAVILAPHAQMMCETPFRCGYFEASGQVEQRQNPFPGAVIRSAAVTVFPREPVFHGRLIALVDGVCASACEDFLVAFAASRRGPMVGQTTAGSSGQPWVQSFDEDMVQFSVGTTRFLFPDGTPLEGVGIVPHVQVEVTQADLRDGRDAVLAAALDLASVTQAGYEAVFGARKPGIRQG